MVWRRAPREMSNENEDENHHRHAAAPTKQIGTKDTKTAKNKPREPGTQGRVVGEFRTEPDTFVCVCAPVERTQEGWDRRKINRKLWLIDSVLYLLPV